MNRRDFINQASGAAGFLAVFPLLPSYLHFGCSPPQHPEPFKLALNQWSLFSSFVGDTGRDGFWSDFYSTLQTDPASVLQGEFDPLDFPEITRKKFSLDAIELEASLYFAHASDMNYFQEFKNRCNAEGIKCLFISNVWSGNLGSTNNDRKPKEIAENYFKWVDIAGFLGCHSLMVNVNSRGGDKQIIKKAAVEGLGRLVDYSEKQNIHILIENHNWYSADPVWLVDIIREVNNPFCKFNVDFGNFCQKGWRNAECIEPLDPYEGVKLMMPYAKAISAKTMKFDEKGNESFIDYTRMLSIVRDSGYNGYLGIEYSGDQFPYEKGVKMTIDLINRTYKKYKK